MSNFTEPVQLIIALGSEVNGNPMYMLCSGVCLAATVWLRLVKYSSKSAVEASAKTNEAQIDDDEASSKSISSHLTSQNLDGVIFFCSQTGTAEEYARRLARAIQSAFPLHVGVADPEEFNMATLSKVAHLNSKNGGKKFVGFVAATYGDGEPTDNAIQLKEFLSDNSRDFVNERTRAEKPLQGLNYLAFGLGNNSYEHFNYMVRFLKKSLDQLGASCIGDAGEGDDGSGTMDEDFLQWKDATLHVLGETMGLKKSKQAWTPSYTTEEQHSLDRFDQKVNLGDRAFSKQSAEKYSLARVPVQSSRQLYNSQASPERRECIHIELDLSGTGLTYTTGDHVGVAATNPEPEVDRLLRILGLLQCKDSVILASQLHPDGIVIDKQYTTFATLLRYRLEICGSVSRESIATLAQFAPTAAAKDVCTRLTTDLEYFRSLVHSQCLNLGQVLEFASAGVPWRLIPFAALLDVIPILQPRYYSISSSNVAHPNTIHITAAVKKDVFHQEHDNRTFHGVASNYLRALSKARGIEHNDCIAFELQPPRMQLMDPAARIQIRSSSFRLPPNPGTPIIMVGPGTGVAPFRAFMQERAKIARDGGQVGTSLLYFGCRRREEDFLYSAEWDSVEVQLDDAFVLRTAFSREAAGKVYVQDKLKEDRSLVIDLLEKQNAWFYICGDAKHMAKDVYHTLAAFLSEARECPEADGDKYIQELKSAGRFHEDIW